MNIFTILLLVVSFYIFYRIGKFLIKITPPMPSVPTQMVQAKSSNTTPPNKPVNKPTNKPNPISKSTDRPEKSEKDSKVYFSTIAKTWLKDNFAYLNQVFNDADDDDSTVLLKKEKLPEELGSWEYIGNFLLEAEEITSFNIINDGLKIII